MNTVNIVLKWGLMCFSRCSPACPGPCGLPLLHSDSHPAAPPMTTVLQCALGFLLLSGPAVSWALLSHLGPGSFSSLTAAALRLLGVFSGTRRFMPGASLGPLPAHP